DRGDRAANGERGRAIDRSQVGQRTMRLDMADAMAGGASDPLQSADLIDDDLFNVLGLFALDHPPPEPPDIEKARVRADPDTIFLGPAHGLEHDKRVAAMKPTGDIRRRDDLEHLGVAAHRPGAKALAHVAIEVNSVHRIPPSFRLFGAAADR